MPLFVHRFARERLRRWPGRGQIAKEVPRSCSSASTTPGAARWRPGCSTSSPRAACTCARPAASRRPDQPGVSRRWPRSASTLAGVPEAAHRRGRAGRRRRDHDGLRRRLPDLSRQALRGLGARGPGRQGPRDRAADPRRDRRRGSARCWPSWSPTGERGWRGLTSAGGRSRRASPPSPSSSPAAARSSPTPTTTARSGRSGVALVFGLVIMVMVYATGHLSGAHINPAVTLAFTLTRHFPAREAVAYVAAQLAGATAGRAAAARRLDRQAGRPRRHGAERRRRQRPRLRARADRVPDVRDHGRRHRHARGRAPRPRSRSAARSASTRCSAARSRAPR